MDIFHPSNGIRPEDANQGYISNCYLISSISALAEFPDLITRLFNVKTNKSSKHVYSVNLCINGLFVEFVMDGYFPVDGNEMIKFCNSKTDVIWPLLLEKAYAKAFGAYWNIGGAGAPCRALKDLTGAPTEFVKFKDHSDDEVFSKIITADKKNYIMVSPTKGSPQEVQTDLGMIPFHAYTVISALQIGNEKIIKLRNPHGKGEWKGDWSDSSSKWTKALRKKHNVQDSVDGTFYMPIKNFKQNFIEVAICHYNKQNIYSQRELVPSDMKGLKAWKIHVSTAGEYYVGLSQPDKRHVEVSETVYTTMIMFKCVDGSHQKLEYMGGRLYIERDPFFNHTLSPGSYILFVI